MFAPVDARLGRFAAWGTAVLRSRIGIDDAMDALCLDLDSVSVIGLARSSVAVSESAPGSETPLGLALAFGELRRLGVSGLAFLPAAPGDVSALPGPLEFNAAAVRAGGAVVTTDGVRLGLLADIDERGPTGDVFTSIEWRAYPVASFAAPAIAALTDADRDLMETIHTTLRELNRLDVPQWQDDVAELLASWRHGGAETLPPGLPERAARLLDRTERIGELLELAQGSDGGSITAVEAESRRLALLPLARAVRTAAAAAWNCGLSPAAAAH
ncbi:MAG TPA: hypothetical protein VMT88_03680 [Actinomycetes bacterium]|nr:hypothetical protein [Actinomycetes bacterium]